MTDPQNFEAFGMPQMGYTNTSLYGETRSAGIRNGGDLPCADGSVLMQVDQLAVAPDPHNSRAPWSLPQRIFFRFVFSYFVLYTALIILSLLPDIPPLSWLAEFLDSVWHTLIPWVAVHMFHLSGKDFDAHSGDTALNYIQVLLFVVFSAAATVTWSLAVRGRKDHRWLHSWLRVLVRYSLAYMMLTYGLCKVFPVQFGSGLDFMSLTEPYGDFSPMGVLWKFMGASRGYAFFGGMCEVVGAVLLLFRRTTTLGAMVNFAVLLNVVLLNFCYDVPVKLISSNLLLMAIFLAAPDFRRLLNFLVLNRGNEPMDLSAPRFECRSIQISANAFQVIVVGWLLWSAIDLPWKAYKESVNEIRPPIYGLYAVETFSRDGQELPPLITDSSRWKKVSIQHPGKLGIRMMDDSTKSYNAQYHVATNAVALWDDGKEGHTNVLVYSWVDADHVVLQGNQGTNALAIRLQRIDKSKLLLLNRGFHWINEKSFNR